MSERRFRRVNRRTAEQQGPGGALDRLLADASAPAHASELAGEEAAVAAFRTARLTDAGQPRRRSMHRLTKLVTIKVAAAAIGAIAVGGVAFAAATGNLPSQDKPAGPGTTSGTPGVPGDKPGKGESKDNPNSADKDKPDNGNSTGNPSPSPSLNGLCQAYSSGNDQGKRLDNPAFGALITAAGGADKVPAFCLNLLGQPSNGQKPGENKEKDPKPGNPQNPPNPQNTENPGRGHEDPPGKPDGPPPSARPNN